MFTYTVEHYVNKAPNEATVIVDTTANDYDDEHYNNDGPPHDTDNDPATRTEDRYGHLRDHVYRHGGHDGVTAVATAPFHIRHSPRASHLGKPCDDAAVVLEDVDVQDRSSTSASQRAC